MNESGGDFKQDSCRYKPTSGIHWTPKHSWIYDRPQKQASEKQTSQLVAVVLWWLVSLLMKLLIGDETRSLPLCVYVAGFGKSIHKYVFTDCLSTYLYM